MSDSETTEDRVRELPAAASFSLTVSLLSWIEAESKRRGVKKSVVVREILDAARSESEREQIALAS